MKLKTMLFVAVLGGPLTSTAMAGEPVISRPTNTASGRNGAVEIRLELFKTGIKVGESLFARTKLVNRAKQPMRVSEWIYRGSPDLAQIWANNGEVKVGTFIEVRDSADHPVRPEIYVAGYDVNPFEMKISTPDAETLKLVSELKSKGLRDSEINAKLREQSVMRERNARDAKYPPIKLKSGQSITSAQWCSGRAVDAAGFPVCPGDGFVELPFYSFSAPGRYRVRAVRDLRPDEADAGNQWGVLSATDWISFEVFK